MRSNETPYSFICSSQLQSLCVCVCASLFSPSNSNSLKKKFRAFSFPCRCPSLPRLIAGHNSDKESKNQFDCHYNHQLLVMLGGFCFAYCLLFYVEKRLFQITLNHIIPYTDNAILPNIYLPTVIPSSFTAKSYQSFFDSFFCTQFLLLSIIVIIIVMIRSKLHLINAARIY